MNARFKLVGILLILPLLGSVASGAEQVIIAPGAGSYTVPSGVDEITVEVWGAGGSGEETNRGGGGGGAYARATIPVSPGADYSYQVGAGASSGSSSPGGNTWFGSSDTVLAEGGQSATGRPGAQGGRASASIGAVRFDGGNGARGVFATRGGGGGSSAGPGAAGTDASGGVGADAPEGGGDGGDEGGTVLIFFGGDGEPGQNPGGGGGGGGSFGAGGAGGDGQIRITWQAETYCSDIYTDPGGINNNLPQSRQLDLGVFDPRSPVPWPSNNIIPTGSHVYPARDFSGNNIDITVDGKARVLVDGDMTISGNNFTLNTDGNADDLLLIVDGDLTFKNNAELNAVVYVTGNIDFKNNSVIVGALAAEGSIDIGGGNSEFTYEENAAGNVDFGGSCAPDVNTPELDHLRIVHPDIGLTCRASQVSIRACADPACNTLYTDPVDVVMDPAGWAPSAAFSVVGGSATRGFQRSSAGVVSLDVAGAYPPPENDKVCISSAGNTSCVMEFRDAGFFFDLPDTKSGVEDTFTMVALEKDSQSGQCVAMFEDQDLDVGFSSSYLIPGPLDRTDEYPVYIKGTAINNDGTGWTPVEINFKENGEAEVPFRYDDTGEMGLSATYEAPGQPDGGTLIISGSDSFVTGPYGLCLIPEKQCASAELGCTSTHVAGTPFDVTPKAYAWTSNVASLSCSDKFPSPSFEITDLQMENQVLLPAIGSTGAALETIDFGAGVQSLTFTEVGIFEANTVAEPGAYLGQDVPESDPMRSPRLIPDYLEVMTLMSGSFDPAYPGDPANPDVPECSGFTYQGQPFGWESGDLPQLQVEAYNAVDAMTTNYTHPDMIARLSADQFDIQVPAQDEAAELADGSYAPFSLTSGASVLTAGTVEESEPGIALYSVNGNDEFLYPKEPETRINPFFPGPAFMLEALEDLDGVQANNIPEDGLTIEPAADFSIFYGRINLENAYGPETSALEIPMRAEVFQDGQFEVNLQENCWTYDLNEDTTVDYSESALDASDTQVIDVDDGGLTLLNGRPDTTGLNDYRLRFSAPGTGAVEGTGNKGIYVELDTGNTWLKDFWDPDQPETLLNPSAWATFGVYRGHDRIIYWREVTD